MAESVDALVSNTSGATRAGSTPALGTRLESKDAADDEFAASFFVRKNIKIKEMPNVTPLCKFSLQKLVQSVSKFSTSLELSNLLGSNLDLFLC